MKTALWLALILSQATQGSIASSLTTQDQSLWSLDLSGAGYLRPDDQKNFAYLLTIRHRVIFLDEKTIAVTFLTRNEVVGLTRPGHPGSSYVLKTAFIDVGKGTVQESKIWGNAADEFDLVAADEGRFAVLDRSGISLYSESLEQLAHVKHQPDTVATEGPPPNRKMFPDLNYSNWWLESSPTGRTLVAVHSGGFRAIVKHFTTDHLALLNQHEQSSFFSSTASDERFAYTLFSAPGHRVATLNVRSLDATTGSILRVDVQNCEAPAFVTNDLLLVTGLCPYLFLVDKSGEVVAERHLDPQNEAPLGMLPRKGLHIASAPALSRNGLRFAVSESRLVSGSSWGDTFPSFKDAHLVVYDVAGLTPVFSLSEPKPKRNVVTVGAFALSPSGTLVVVLRDNKLTLYRVGNSAEPARPSGSSER